MKPAFEDMNLQIPAVTAEPEDYTGEDGLLYCGKCRTPKEAYFPADKVAPVSYTHLYQKLGKQLMSEDEIAVMDGGKCILQLRGVRPFFSEKYDITKHPKYKYLSDFDKKNAFDMEKHLRRRPAIVKLDEVFDYYEVDKADLQEDAE